MAHLLVCFFVANNVAILYNLNMKTKFNRIYVEITNNCNLNCDFCPKNNRTKQFMPVANFKHCLKQIDNLTNNIYLHVMGEPLLHPMLEEILKTAKQYGKNINLNKRNSAFKKCRNIKKRLFAKTDHKFAQFWSKQKFSKFGAVFKRSCFDR